MRPVLAAAVAALSFFSVPLSIAAGPSPVGQWEVTTGESRFSVRYCGSGHEICARLTWLRADAHTDANLSLLNREVVSHAAPRDENSWAGTIRYNGELYEGTVRLIGQNQLRVESCSGPFCRSFDLRRI